MKLMILGSTPIITSGRYDIEWTQLADLPAPLWDVYVAVQDKRIYITSDASPTIGIACL